MVESESVRTTLHSLEHGPFPLWSGAITKPLAFGTELACDHECIVCTMLGLACWLTLFDAWATHFLQDDVSI